MNPLLISVVTPCFNRVDFIAQAVESVLRQDYPNFEHIIVDGGSTDGTLEVLACYPHLRVISEPDQGIYDAVNKGLRVARGEIIGWMNSDDCYAPGSFQAAAATFDRDPDLDAAAGAALLFDENGAVLREHSPIDPQKLWLRLAEQPPVINAWFFRRRVFEAVGLFDERYRIAGDREFLIRMALHGIRPEPLAYVVCYYQQHLGSYTMSVLPYWHPGRCKSNLRTIMEGLDIYEKALRHPAATKEARYHLRRMHSKRCVRAAIIALYQKDYGLFARCTWRGWRYDPSWPGFFFLLGREHLRDRGKPAAEAGE